MQMPPLETDRLLIRPLAEADLPAVRNVLGADADDAATERHVRHAELNAAVLAALWQPPLGDRALVLRSTGELIGIVGFVPAFGPFGQLRPMDEEPPQERAAALNEIEIGLYYHVDKAQRQRGYASEAARALVDFAFGPMQLKRMIATTERDNLASQAVMRHLGMRLHENALPEPGWFQLVGTLDNARGPHSPLDR